MSATQEIQKCPHAGEVALASPASYDSVLDWFKYLRDNEPVHRDEKGTYFLTRYDDVYAALNDPETFSSNQELEETDFDLANVRSIVYADDPEHLDIRKLVNRAWTPGAVIEFRDRIIYHVDDLFSGLQPGVVFDLAALGLQISQRSFSEAMGLPPDQHERIAKWFSATSAFVRPEKMMRNAGRERAAKDQREQILAVGFPDMQGYFNETIKKYGHLDEVTLKSMRVPPFPRALVAAARKGPDAIQTILTKVMPPLLAGGVSTLSHVFPNAVDVLLDNPELWEQLRGDEGLLQLDGRSDVMEEILRLRGVVQGMPRVTTRDVEVRGTTIPAGALVQLYYLSADYDPEVFPNPESFEDRGLSRHLTFGFGTHTCMGQSLVRLELKVFLRALVKKFVRLERVPAKLNWGGTGVYFTPDRLPVVGY